MANRQDETPGASCEDRFKSKVILDENAMIAMYTHINLSPRATGVVELPETSEHTPVKERGDHLKVQSRSGDLEAAR